jgi:hypothetical protein
LPRRSSGAVGEVFGAGFFAGAGACSECPLPAAGIAASLNVSFVNVSPENERALGTAIEAEFSSVEAADSFGASVGAAGCKAVVTFASAE